MNLLTCFRTLAAGLVISSSFALTPVAAQEPSCTCLVPAPVSGPAGLMSNANGDVFISGSNGLQVVAGSAELGSTTGISTGANGSASVSYGGGCNLALGGSVQVIVTPSAGNLCVQVIEEQPIGGFDGTGAAIVAAGGIAIAGFLYFGLGGIPVSN